MPFPMKIQPIDSIYDFDTLKEPQPIRNDATRSVLKSRLKRLFDRQFPSVLRITSSSEKLTIGGEPLPCKDGGVATEFDPSSVCLAKMVQNFIEESNEKQSAAVKCGRRRCNCFNGNNNESSDDELDAYGSSGDLFQSASDVGEVLKCLIPCSSSNERNLLADTSKIIDKNKIINRKYDLRKIVTDELLSLGYNASICKSRWDKSPSYPAGEYEYIDVKIGEERLLIDVDFRSEFEIARSTSNYKTLLQCLPYVFVGKYDRLQQIVKCISEAAKLSLTKKGMHFPPWRKAEYMMAKWLSPYTRSTPPSNSHSLSSLSSSSFRTKHSGEKSKTETDIKLIKSPVSAETENGEFELIFGEIILSPESSTGTFSDMSSARNSGTPVLLTPWQLPAIKPRSCDRGARVVTGLASLLQEQT